MNYYFTFQSEHASHVVPILSTAPGPGSYSPLYEPVFKTAPSPLLATRAKRFIDDAEQLKYNPSPAHYSPPAQKSVTINFTKAERFASPPKDNHPGIVYSPNFNFVQKAAAKVGFGTAARLTSPTKEVPGPGQYTPTTQHHVREPTAAFGNAKKLQYAKNEVPGPGNYTATYQSHSRSPMSPSFSFGKQHKLGEKFRTESQGAIYDMPKERSMSVSFTKAPNRAPLPKDMTPNGFTYSPNETVVSANERKPSFSFGKQKRDTKELEKYTVPAPNVYSPAPYVLKIGHLTCL